MVKNLSAVQETLVWFLGWEDALEKEMATHSSILAWRIPWTEEPGGLQSMGSKRVGHDWVTNTLTQYHLSFRTLQLHSVGFTESFKEQHSHFLITILILARAKETKWFRQNLGKSQSQALVLLLCSPITKWPPEYSFSFPIFYWFSISKLEPKDIPESLLDIKPEVSGTIIVVSVLDYISNVE